MSTVTKSRVAAEELGTLKQFQKPISCPWKVILEPAQLEVLVSGFRPNDMDDRWFVYADGPDSNGCFVVFFHRSWTGHKIAEVTINTRGMERGHILITRITWESEPKIVSGWDESTAKERIRAVCSGPLGIQLGNDQSG